MTLVGGRANDGVAAGAHPALAGVGLRAGIAVVAGRRVRRLHAAGGGIAAVVRAPVAVVAIPRRAADALAVAAGVVGGAGVAVVAGVRVRDVETAELRVAAVVGADVVGVARRGGARGDTVVAGVLGA